MDTLIGGAFRAVVWLFSLLSLRAQRSLARVLGWIEWRLNTRNARITRTNLRLCFPELSPEQADALALRSLQHTAALLTESGMVFRWPPERWRALIRKVEGEELIQSACDSGSGVLLLVPHFGNWEFLSLYFGDYDVLALYDPPRQRALEAPILQGRSRTGAQLRPIDGAGVKALYQRLREHGFVGLLPDQVPERQGGVYAPFYGRPALTMTFAHRLIRRCQPRVLTCVAQRVADGFHVRILEPDPQIYAEDAELAAAAMNRSIEQLINADPAQYHWEYKRFKRQPPGEPKLYD